MRCFEDSLETVADVIVGNPHGEHLVVHCDALRSVRIGLIRVPSPWHAWAEVAGAVAIFARLPKSCPLLIVDLVGAYDAGAATQTVGSLADALGAVAAIGIETLVVDVMRCGVDETWRSSASVQGLERTCAAKGVALEVRI